MDGQNIIEFKIADRTDMTKNANNIGSRQHNSSEHPKLISIPYIHPIGQNIAIEIGYPIAIQKYVKRSDIIMN